MTKADCRNLTKGWRYSHPLVFNEHRQTVLLVSLIVLAFIGWLDYITGYELGFYIFYYVPVAIASWYCGRKFGIEISVCSALCWYIADEYVDHPYSNAFFIYWETFMRLASFLTIALTLSRIRDLVLNEEKLVCDLLAARQELQTERNKEESDF